MLAHFMRGTKTPAREFRSELKTTRRIGVVRAALACAVLVISAAQQVDAQQTGAAADLVSSWLLVGAERDVASGEPRRVTGSRGLLVLDGAGNVFEFFTAPSGSPANAAQPDPRRIFSDNGGFWGRYEAFPADGRIDFEAEE